MVRSFCLGVIFGLALAVVACGNTQLLTPRCLKSNCSGCCDVNGECQLGNVTAACGSDGAECAACETGATCTAGQCVGPHVDHGTGGGGGSGTWDGGCGAPNCQGCCDPTGHCRGGNTSSSCGKGGVDCSACTGATACIDLSCQAYHCPGCLDSSGLCAPGNLPTACGTDAGACVACGATQSCIAGACVSGATCGAGNCNTCCDGNTCVGGTSAAQCGSGGSLCQMCGSGLDCINGSCTAPPTGGGPTGGGSAGGGAGGGSGGNCSVTNCPGGCCDANRNCRPGNKKAECGILGGACAQCNITCIPGIQVCI